MKFIFLRRAVMGLITCAIALLSVIGPAMPASAAVDSPSDLTVKSQVSNLSQATVSWKAPLTVRQITAYRLRLDGTAVAEFKLTNGEIKTSYTMDATPLRAGGQLTVSAVFDLLQEGTASQAITLPPMPTGALVTADPAGSKDTYQPNGFGGSITTPPYKDSNQPAANEVYGNKSGILQLITTADPKTDFAAYHINMVISWVWMAGVMLSLFAISALSWSLITSVYSGLAGAITMVITSFGGSYMRVLLGLGVVILTAGYAYWMARKGTRSISNMMNMSIVVLGASLLLFGNSTAIVPAVVNSPLVFTQGTITVINGWVPPGVKTADYNLSVKPTFNGSILEQGVRRYAYENWLETTYPGYCVMNFGDLAWATTTRVVDPSVPKGYNNLTFCEYLLKAQTSNNTAALDKLRSYDTQAGLGAHTSGLVEKSSQEAWAFYQGTSPSSMGLRAGYSVALLASSFLNAVLIVVIALLVAFSVMMMGYGMLLLAGILIVSQAPPLLDYLKDQLRSMFGHTWRPALGMGSIMVVDRITRVVFTTTGPTGWLVAEILRGLACIILVAYAFHRFRGHGHRRAGAISEPATRPQSEYREPVVNVPRSPSNGSSVRPAFSAPATVTPRPAIRAGALSGTIVPVSPSMMRPRPVSQPQVIRGEVLTYEVVRPEVVRKAPQVTGSSVAARKAITGSSRALPSAPSRR